MWEESWATKAACRQLDDALAKMFVRGAAQNKEKAVCANCEVRLECLTEALDNGIQWGIWGGMTERERRALLRKTAIGGSWRAVLEREKIQTVV